MAVHPPVFKPRVPPLTNRALAMRLCSSWMPRACSRVWSEGGQRPWDPPWQRPGGRGPSSPPPDRYQRVARGATPRAGAVRPPPVLFFDPAPDLTAQTPSILLSFLAHAVPRLLTCLAATAASSGACCTPIFCTAAVAVVTPCRARFTLACPNCKLQAPSRVLASAQAAVAVPSTPSPM